MNPKLITEMTFEVMWIYPVLTMSLGICAGYLAHLFLTRVKASSDAKDGRRILSEARKQAEIIRHEAELDSRDLQLKLREQFEQETKARRREIVEQQGRVEKREANADRRVALMDRKEAAVEEKREQLEQEKNSLDEEAKALAQSRAETLALDQLGRAAKMRPEEARRELMIQIEKECRMEAAELAHHLQIETRKTAEERARDIVVTAIERYASSHVSEITSSMVCLPNDEMKGRIIGRDGRNIRCLEMETGCNILIDDTPGMVVVSAFDPIRREVARCALEQLIEDGRIHPARIEEMVANVRDKVDTLVQEAGEEAVRELNLTDIAPELIHTLGQLRFRHSFTQNVLRHSVEVGHLMGMMAADLGLNPATARRVGLFHDLGKAVDHEVPGGHAEIGANLLGRYGESPEVVNAVKAHHHEAEADNPYAPLVAAADAITAARPGARSENVKQYLQRLSQIESIAASFTGVRQCFAVQAGRELRVLVAPEQIDDADLTPLAREISRRLSESVRFSGQIRVTVIRETRCVEYAR